MGRPTENAVNYFSNARIRTRNAVALRHDPAAAQREQDVAYEEMISGLQSLAVGLRATYILLEEVKGLLQKQR